MTRGSKMKGNFGNIEHREESGKWRLHVESFPEIHNEKPIFPGKFLGLTY